MSVERTFIRSVFLLMVACSLGVAAPGDDQEIGQALRRFRIQTFQSFRSERDEYDRRVQYVQSVVDTWSRSGAPRSKRSSLIEFLQRATSAAQRGQPMPQYKASKAATNARLRRRNARRNDLPGRRPTVSDIVAPEVPVFPRQPDGDWATLRGHGTSGDAISLSTLRLQSRVPRATRFRIAWKPAPASSVRRQRPSSTAAESSTESAVDLTLLAARIRASNLKLSEVESELMARGEWDVQRLEPLVEQFDEILSGRRLSRLYYEALNDSERKQLFTAISPPQPVLSLLSQRWFEARVASADATAEGEWPSDGADSGRLQRIARTIDMWKSEYPGYRN